MSGLRIVLALGGNAISDPASRGTIPEQFARTRETCVFLVDLFEAGHRVLLTHGNGPQVGNILRRVELAAPEVYPIDLGLCVADSQAGMGYMITQCWGNELYKRHHKERYPITIVTTVVVDRDDPAFRNPTKPIGIYYSKDQADEMIRDHGWSLKEIKGKGWRRVVASPEPQQIVEVQLIKRLFDSGEHVVACGGGGIPIIWTDGWGYEGLEAVIDKDLTSALLAQAIDADLFLIVTGEDAAYTDFGKPTQKRLDRLTTADAEKLLAEGQFPAGSMGPKIQAGINFVRHSTRPGVEALITSVEHAMDGINGRSGTRIVPC